MTPAIHTVRFASIALLAASIAAPLARAADEVAVETGKLQGTINKDHTVRIFKGVPFAAPPIGDLRWKAPQPAPKWTGVRPADKFGSACLQTDVYGDIYFRDKQPSEDCLNLVIWVPANADTKPLPVFVWYYGGGFVAGGNSEVRYDGEALAKKGIIVVEPNYRLGVFGFFSHPELSKESGKQASGNYGLLDQVAALQWVVKNIAAFGGDPHNITIGGESAGSMSVSGLMASPLSRDLFQKALGESGAFFPSPDGRGLRTHPRSETEHVGAKFAASVGAASLAQMRAKPANDLLQAAAKYEDGFAFGPNLDGYFLPSTVQAVFEHGKQSKVALLAGWNADENTMEVLLSPSKTTAKSFTQMAQARFGEHAPQFLKLYPALSDAEALASAEALAGDDFIAFATWKWIELQRRTGNAPVYHYRFEQVPATMPGAKVGPVPASAAGARHAGEIEYVFETLQSQQGAPWTDDDYKVSAAMANYWANFIKTGDPNGKDLPQWPKSEKANGYQVMHLSGKRIGAEKDALRTRYEFLDAHPAQPK
jgi:para-nitrobenzyl esterase